MPQIETLRRPPLLYAPDVGGRSAAEVLHVPAEEARHMRALRLEPGSPVRLTDGHGTMWLARLRAASGDRVACVLEVEMEAPPGLPVYVGFGVGNKTHTLWLVEKATELGVVGLSPVEFSRSASVADAARPPSFWEKAGRRAVSAMKQSGGARLPALRAPRPLRAFLEDPGPADHRAGRDIPAPSVGILLDQAADPLRRVVQDWNGSPPLVLLVGPEGGLTDAERTEVLAAGFRLARLGPLILRFETAAIAAVAVVAQQLEAARGGGTETRSASASEGENA